MIKVASCHQLIPQPWHIFTTAGLGSGRAIVCILREPHLPNSSYREFDNLNKNMSLALQTKFDKMLSDPILSRITYVHILLFVKLPGLYFASYHMR